MINPYSYFRQDNNDKCDLKEETPLFLRYRINFPSAQSLRYLGNTGVLGDYYLPKNVSRAPLAIIVHGMGDRSMFPCRLIANTLSRKGMACFILYLVFHKSRAPALIREKYPALSAEEWFESYQVSVTDIHQVIDWSCGRPEIDQDRISVLGISFGSFVSSIAMALDKRIRAGIFVESGGNSDKLTKHSLLLRWQYKHNKETFLRDQESYAKYLAEVEEKGFENVTVSKSSYLTDPLTFSRYVRDRPILMLNALLDEMIPRVATLELWKAYGKPRIFWYPATHASIWLWYPFMGPRIYNFLNSVTSSGRQG